MVFCSKAASTAVSQQTAAPWWWKSARTHTHKGRRMKARTEDGGEREGRAFESLSTVSPSAESASLPFLPFLPLSTSFTSFPMVICIFPPSLLSYPFPFLLFPFLSGRSLILPSFPFLFHNLPFRFPLFLCIPYCPIVYFFSFLFIYSFSGSSLFFPLFLAITSFLSPSVPTPFHPFLFSL